MSPLTLTRLTRQQVEAMVLRVTGEKPLPAEVLAQVVAKTDGIPLFIEELVKTIREAGVVQETAGRYVLTGPLPPLAIPATLQDALMARLDRLAVVKEVAQLGAVLGREFAYALLRAVAPLEEGALQQALARLVEAELLYQRGLPPQATYLFKHALIQDAAYQSLLKSTRQQYHQRIAQVLEARFPETAETQPERLAQHYTEAGLLAQALPYWQRAGQRAIARSAHAEAIGHLTRGLDLITTLPETSARIEQEIALQVALGQALMVARGQGAPEVERAFSRAWTLCQQVEESPQRFPVLWGLWRWSFMQARNRTALERGETCLRLAQRVQDPALLLPSHLALGGTCFMLGDQVSARAHLEQGIALYDAQQHRALAFHYGVDLHVWCLGYVAWPVWLLGYPAQALRRSQEAISLARELAHPLSLVAALTYAAWLHQFRREAPATQAQAEAAITLAREYGFPQYETLAMNLRAWALAAQRQDTTVGTTLRQTMAENLAVGSANIRPYMLTLLADLSREEPEVGLAALEEALSLVDTTDERWWEAELYRCRGELLLKRAMTDATQAEACFHQALTVARQQQAKSLELRATMSLARLWQRQGKRTEARELLASIYAWFTEGFDTADLQEARAMLDALA